MGDAIHEVGICPLLFCPGSRRTATRRTGAATERAASNVLEVTTPGLDRPLETGRDFRRQRGHEVEILREASAEQPRSQLRGVVAAADDQAVTLEVGGSQVRVPLSDVVRGKVVLPW